MATYPKPLTIALISHDNKKNDMVQLALEFKTLLSDPNVHLIGTGTTGGRVEQALGATVEKMASGPLGGDAQIAARIVDGKVGAVIFLVDPLFAHPHEPDIQGLIRVMNLKNIPYATNMASAKIVLEHIQKHL
jgi:methylglyoxal synthase